MPSTLAGQLTIVSLTLGIFVVLFKAKRGYDKDKAESAHKQSVKDAEDALHRGWIEELWLEYCRKTGVRVSDDLMRKHMRINGNARLSSAEKDRVYGTDRPREHDSDELIIDAEGKARKKSAGEL